MTTTMNAGRRTSRCREEAPRNGRMSLREIIDRAEQHGPDGMFPIGEANLRPSELGSLALHLRRIDGPAAKVLRAIGSDNLTLAEIEGRIGKSRSVTRALVADLVGRGKLVRTDDGRYRRRKRGGSAWRLTNDQQQRLIAGLIEAKEPAQRICQMAGTTRETLERVRERGSRHVENGSAFRSTSGLKVPVRNTPVPRVEIGRFDVDPITATGIIFRREIPKGLAFIDWVFRLGTGAFVEWLIDYRDPQGEALFVSTDQVAGLIRSASSEKWMPSADLLDAHLAKRVEA